MSAACNFDSYCFVLMSLEPDLLYDIDAVWSVSAVPIMYQYWKMSILQNLVRWQKNFHSTSVANIKAPLTVILPNEYPAS